MESEGPYKLVGGVFEGPNGFNFRIVRRGPEVDGEGIQGAPKIRKRYASARNGERRIENDRRQGG